MKYTKYCGFKVHPLNKICKCCGNNLVRPSLNPALYKREAIKKQTEADKVRREGKY